jgi:hypothetical protein
MNGVTPKRVKRQGVLQRGRRSTTTSHLVLGALIIMLLLIVSIVAKNAYKEEPIVTATPAQEAEHRVPAHHRPAPPAEKPHRAPLSGGVM